MKKLLLTTALVAMTAGVAHAAPTLYAGTSSGSSYNVGNTLDAHEGQIADIDNRTIDNTADIGALEEDTGAISRSDDGTTNIAGNTSQVGNSSQVGDSYQAGNSTLLGSQTTYGSTNTGALSVNGSATFNSGIDTNGITNTGNSTSTSTGRDNWGSGQETESTRVHSNTSGYGVSYEYDSEEWNGNGTVRDTDETRSSLNVGSSGTAISHTGTNGETNTLSVGSTAAAPMCPVTILPLTVSV